MSGTAKVTELPEEVVVHTTRHVNEDVHEQPSERRVYRDPPQPQTANPNWGRGGDDRPAPTASNDGSVKVLLTILVIIALCFLALVLYKYRGEFTGLFDGSPASTGQQYSDTSKTEDRIVDESSFTRQPAVAPQQTAEVPARSNPTKEKYLADCAAAGAPVIQTASGMRCQRPSTVTVHSGQLPPALANARTVEEYKRACNATPGARYWTEASGKPRCTK